MIKSNQKVEFVLIVFITFTVELNRKNSSWILFFDKRSVAYGYSGCFCNFWSSSMSIDRGNWNWIVFGSGGLAIRIDDTRL
jgi:hypothetical protein